MSLASAPPYVYSERRRPRAMLPREAPRLAAALVLALVGAFLGFALHTAINLQAQHVGYGLFRDELYYIVCGHRLAWGYLDNQPLIVVITRITDTLFGHQHLWTFRLVATLASAAKIFLTGMLTRSLGGRRRAQAAAMICVLMAPEYLGIDTILTMNCLEPVFWMTATLALIEVIKQPRSRYVPAWWITFGIAGGLALETKLSGAFFFLCLLAALLLTPQRRLLLNRWAALAVALICFIEAPNIVWQWQRSFPTIQWLVAVSHEGKDVVLGPLAFLWQQVLVLNPFNSVLWVAGLGYLLFHPTGRRFRSVGLCALFFIALMLVLRAKVYYVVPVYPVLFAAGSVFISRLLAPYPAWRILPLAYVSVFALASCYWETVILPIIPPSHYAIWEQRLHFRPEETEVFRRSPLPQLLADMTSWPQLVEQVAAAYNSLPADQRSHTGIYCSNYGKASAIDVYGPAHGLPPAISGHQTFWFWGPQGQLRNSMIVIGASRAAMDKYFVHVRAIARIDTPYAMPFENGNVIWLGEGLRQTPEQMWPQTKLWY